MQRLFIGISFFLWIPYVFSSQHYTFESVAQQAQFQALLHDLRCPVCQNQDLADSNAEVASDLRQEVYEKVLAHQSDQEIIRYLSERYGSFISFKPPVTMLTSILWFGPFVLFIIGIALFLFFGIRRRGSYD